VTRRLAYLEKTGTQNRRNLALDPCVRCGRGHVSLHEPLDELPDELTPYIQATRRIQRKSMLYGGQSVVDVHTLSSPINYTA
jgi:hypothetical protein